MNRPINFTDYEADAIIVLFLIRRQNWPIFRPPSMQTSRVHHPKRGRFYAHISTSAGTALIPFSKARIWRRELWGRSKSQLKLKLGGLKTGWHGSWETGVSCSCPLQGRANWSPSCQWFGAWAPLLTAPTIWVLSRRKPMLCHFFVSAVSTQRESIFYSNKV